jgi:hypothetical protein
MDTDFVAPLSPPSGGYIPFHSCSSRFLFEKFSGHHLGRYGDAFEFIGGLTMKQGKNIVKQVRSKDALFRPVPSA